jgi:hypothetical protein
MSKNIMLDLETLSTRVDGAILSIGAVKFDLEKGKIDDKGFYSSVSIDSNVEANRHISESTLLWWMDQGEDAKRLFKEAKVVLSESLDNFRDWVGRDDCAIWGNGSDFDVAMLAHAFNTHGLDTPWKFFNVRCFRTFKNLPGAPRCAEPPLIKHHALHDALSQAKHALAIQAALFGKKALVAA